MEGRGERADVYLLKPIVWTKISNDITAIPDLPHRKVVHALPDQAPEQLGVLQLDSQPCVYTLVPVVELVIVLV